MDSLISRQAAIDALGEKPLVWDDLSDFDLGKAAQWSDDVDAIKELPSAQPQWIPVSERLPEVRQWVLCQCRAGIMDVLRLTDDDCWYRKSNEIYMSGFVLAWMPLPEPYRGG